MMKEGFAGPNTWPCCGVTAVATALEIPFAVVLDHIRHKSNYQENWKGSTVLSERLEALDYFGATYNSNNFKRRYGKLRFWQWALLHAKSHTTYLIDVPGHTVVFRDHMIIDQAHPTPTHFALSERLGGMSVNQITEIVSIPTEKERKKEQEKAQDEITNLF